MGQIASTIANVHIGRGGKRLIPDDFALGVPKTEAEKQAETEAELRAALKNASHP